MKKFTTATTLAALGTLLIPAVSLAATYHYVTLDGTVDEVQASTAAQALVMVDARDDSIHSGVQLDTGVLDEGEQVGHEYTYVALDGSVKTITAASLDAATVLATDRKYDSGFMVKE